VILVSIEEFFVLEFLGFCQDSTPYMMSEFVVYDCILGLLVFHTDIYGIILIASSPLSAVAESWDSSSDWEQDDGNREENFHIIFDTFRWLLPLYLLRFHN
jgi:hypothetical protein